MISCQTLGPIEVTCDGHPAPHEVLWRKHLALLIYLARSPRRTRTREHLARLLWADKPEAAARHSLNEALRVVRRAAGDQAIETKVEQVTLHASAVDLDVDAFESLVSEGQFKRATDMILGEFLEGFAVPGASEFDDWLSAERRHWTARCVTVLAEWSGQLAREGRVEEAVKAATRALDLDPIAEMAVASLLRALALAGEPAAALRRAEDYSRRLEEALGCEASPAIRRLVEQIRKGRARPAIPAVSRSGLEVRRVPLVGRETELKTLVDCWEQVRSGEGARLALIIGDPGTGKSRLAEEVGARARLDGATIVSVRAIHKDRDDPLAGILAAVRGPLLETPGLAGVPPETLASFVALLPSWQERFPHIERAPETDLERSFTDLLRVVTEDAPVVLIFDDADSMDEESVAVLRGTLRDIPRAALLVCLVTNTMHQRDDLDHLRAKIGRDIPGASVTIGALDQPALHGMISWALPGYDATQVKRLGRRLAMDSAGLPLLATELLHAVACGLDLQTLATAWPEPLRTLDQSMPGDLPDTVVGSIRVGFRQLSEDAQAVLQAVAVMPDRAEPERLGHLLELPVDRVLEALDELEWTRWLMSEPRGYSFVARITQKVIARDMLTPGQRQRLRVRLGEVTPGDR